MGVQTLQNALENAGSMNLEVQMGSVMPYPERMLTGEVNGTNEVLMVVKEDCRLTTIQNGR